MLKRLWIFVFALVLTVSVSMADVGMAKEPVLDKQTDISTAEISNGKEYCGTPIAVFGNLYDTVPAGWTLKRNYAAVEISDKSGAKITDGGLNLYFDTSMNAEAGDTTLVTETYELKDEQIVIRFVTDEAADTEVYKMLKLLDNKANAHQMEVLRLQNGKLTIFGGEKSVELDGETGITIVIDTKYEWCTVWVDDTIIYNGFPKNWETSLDYAHTRLKFVNGASTPVALKSEWNIRELACTTLTGTFAFSSEPSGETPFLAYGKNVQLTYGTEMAPSAYSKDCFTVTENSAVLDEFTVMRTETGVELNVAGGFKESASYAVSIPELYNLYGEKCREAEILEFHVMPEEYEEPEIVFAGESAAVELTEGENVVLPFQVTKGLPKQVILKGYGGDIEIFSSGGRLYACFLTPVNGRYTVHAEMTDSIGKTAKSEEVTLQVHSNSAPLITISGVKEGDALEIVSPDILISASDTDGVRQLSVKDNNIKLAENYDGKSLTVRPEELGTGNHRLTVSSEDSFGKKAERNISFLIEKNVYEEKIAYDFNSWENYNDITFGNAPQNGYVSVQKIDNEHGNSLVVGFAGGNEGESDFPWVNLDNQGLTGVGRSEFDMYISGEGDYFHLEIYQQSGTLTSALRIVGDELICGSGETMGTAKIAYQRWYRIRLDMDILQHIYTVYVDGERIGSGEIPPGLTRANYLRFYGPLNNTHAYATLDNLQIYGAVTAPKITGLREEKDGYVSKTQKTLTFIIGDKVMSKSQEEAGALIRSSDGSHVPVKSMSALGNTVSVELEQSLESGESYTAALKGLWLVTSNRKIDADLSYAFRTSVPQIEVLNAAPSRDGNFLAFEATNLTNEAKSCYVIYCISKNGRLASTEVIKMIVPSGEEKKKYTLSAPKLSETGQHWECFVWDDLIKPQSLLKSDCRYTQR